MSDKLEFDHPMTSIIAQNALKILPSRKIEESKSVIRPCKLECLESSSVVETRRADSWGRAKKRTVGYRFSSANGWTLLQ